MARETILAMQENLAFAYYEKFGCFVAGISDLISKPLIAGEEYIVSWDGSDYVRDGVAFTNPADGTNCVAIGNPIAYGGADNRDGFTIVYDATNNYAYAFSLSINPTHSVAIYEETINPNDVVLKDHGGTDITYPAVSKVLIPSVDGETMVPFTYGELMDDVTIELKFADENMPISVPDGYLVKEATVIKPSTLIPDNIAEGIEIAGVIGTHKGGGGVDFDLSGDFLKYIVYQLDFNAMTITITGILYEDLYNDTGSYDVNIPDTFGDFAVILNTVGV